MAKTPLSLKSIDAKDPIASTEENELGVLEPQTQRRRPCAGRYRLQVDRQTKASYGTFEEAEAKGLHIKKQFAQVQVAIYMTRKKARTRCWNCRLSSPSIILLKSENE
jgi:hypothetical protein